MVTQLGPGGCDMLLLPSKTHPKPFLHALAEDGELSAEAVPVHRAHTSWSSRAHPTPQRSRAGAHPQTPRSCLNSGGTPLEMAGLGISGPSPPLLLPHKALED